MPKRITTTDAEALAFGHRLTNLLADKGQPRRGAGAYLAKRYKVATVTANAWLNGEYRASTVTARQIAVDHGSTFDALYFGVPERTNESAKPAALDHTMVAKVARALRKVKSDPNNEKPFTFDFITEYGLFIQLYEEAIQGRLTPTNSALKIGRWQERRHQGDDVDGRRDGLPATGTHKGAKGA